MLVGHARMVRGAQPSTWGGICLGDRSPEGGGRDRGRVGMAGGIQGQGSASCFSRLVLHICLGRGSSKQASKQAEAQVQVRKTVFTEMQKVVKMNTALSSVWHL